MTNDRSTTETQANAIFRGAALAEIGGALAELADASLDAHTCVHRVRKRCKRLRSLYRLVRPGFSGYALESVAVRDISRRLSELRDAQASVETFAAFFPRAERRWSRTALHSVRKALIVHRDTLAAECSLPGELKQVRARFVEVRGRVGSWRLDPDAPDGVRAGLRVSYERARARFAAISKQSSAAQVHDWRKRTKDYRLQQEFLAPAEPRPTQHLASLDFISRRLGEHHDLHVLTGALITMRSELSRDLELPELLHLIELRQTGLLSAALARGRRAFAEPTVLHAMWRDEPGVRLRPHPSARAIVPAA